MLPGYRPHDLHQTIGKLLELLLRVRGDVQAVGIELWPAEVGPPLLVPHGMGVPGTLRLDNGKYPVGVNLMADGSLPGRVHHPLIPLLQPVGGH